MITGQPGPDFFAGIWNCTYIWPIVICCGTVPAAGAAGAPGGGRDGRVVADLRDAADEEAALVLEHERPAHESLRRALGGDPAASATTRVAGIPRRWICGVKLRFSFIGSSLWTRCSLASGCGLCPRGAP